MNNVLDARKFRGAFAGSVLSVFSLLTACGGGSSNSASASNIGVLNTGTPITGTPDSGTPDSGIPDSGTPVPAPPRSGTAEAITPGTGTPTTVTPVPSATPNVWHAPTPTLDRINFGDATSEKSHAFKNGDSGLSLAGVGAFSQTYRQPRLVVYGTQDADNKDKLAFTVAVDAAKQNYLTVKLFGSDGNFGALYLTNPLSSPTGDVEIDNNIGNSAPFFGRFHFATVAIPIAWTKGKTSVSISLYSSGYFYDNGSALVGKPTRPIYSAFVHVDPFFVPSTADEAGVAPPLASTLQPMKLTRQQAYGYMRGMRGDIFDINNRQPGRHPGGWFKQMGGCAYDAPSAGLPAELVGLNVKCPADQALIDAMASKPNAADAWRNEVATWGVGEQVEPLNVNTAAYLLPPFVNENGNVESGYDRYHDPAVLKKIVGLLDGLARMQGRGGSWDTACSGSSDARWAGITSSPRAVGPWSGSKDRQEAGCVTFEGGDAHHIGRSVLRLLNDDAFAATAFKVYLDQPIDADLNGVMVKRAYMYQRMLGRSRAWMGFDPVKANTSDNFFDKAGITAVQALIFQQHAYSGQLALRQLLALFPGSALAIDAPLDPALQRSIVRQLIGLERPIVLNHAPPGTDWRVITKAGVSETYGTLSSGYDGRYGGGIPATVANIVSLSKYDTSLSSTDRDDFGEVGRRTVAAFVNFFYPQFRIGTSANGPVAHQTFAQEDVISHRVSYGPNVNGGASNWPAYLHAADPAGAVRSPLALRALLFGTQSGLGQDPSGVVDHLALYHILESTWKSLADVEPSALSAMPGEPGQPDFVWADIESGAVALQWQGERLFLNANFRRPKGDVSQAARLHHLTDLIDRQASVRMPFDAATVQGDGNLSGGASSAWVVRYGRYLVVLNRSTTDYTVTLPAGSGSAMALQRKRSVPMGSKATVAAGGFEAFIFP